MGAGARAAFTLTKRLMPFLPGRVRASSSATEHRLDVLRVIPGGEGALGTRLCVVLLELVVHVLHPGGEVAPGRVEVSAPQDPLHLAECEPFVSPHPPPPPLPTPAP